MTILSVVQGEQEIRRGEGIVFDLTVTNWESSPTPDDITIIRVRDGQDVTADWTSTATPGVAGDVITLPKITVPAGAALGRYRVNVPFTAGGFSPGIPFLDLIVMA